MLTLPNSGEFGYNDVHLSYQGNKLAKRPNSKKPTRRNRNRNSGSSVSIQEIAQLLQTERWDEARACLAKLAYADPTDRGIVVPYLQCLLALERPQDVFDFLAGPIGDRTPDSPLWEIEANAHFLNQDNASAIGILRPRVQQGLADDDELDLLLLLLIAEEKWDQAEELFAAEGRSDDVLSGYALHLAEFGRATHGIELLHSGLAENDERPLLHHVLGLLYMDQQECSSAQQHFERTVELEGQVANYWYNLGLAQTKNGQTESAIESYRKAIALEDDYYRAWTNLGTLLSQTEAREEALTVLLRVVELRPHDAMSWYRLGYAQRLVNQPKEAAHSLRQAIRRDVTLSGAWELLVRVLQETEELDHADEVLSEWLERQPNHPVAQHMQASLGIGDVPSRASRDYVESVFDDFADTFEDSLQRLEYHTPELIGQMLQQRLADAHGLRILDAGCGTGLIGKHLRPLAETLVGVDLSSRMLEHAERTGSYDQLTKADLVDFLSDANQTSDDSQKYDLIVAGDVLNYFGDLTEIVELLLGAIRPGGHLLFTVEEGPLVGEDGYYLQPHGRYAHSPPYIIENLGENGIPDGTLRRVALRKENDKDVMALMALCQVPVT